MRLKYREAAVQIQTACVSQSQHTPLFSEKESEGENEEKKERRPRSKEAGLGQGIAWDIEGVEGTEESTEERFRGRNLEAERLSRLPTSTKWCHLRAYLAFSRRHAILRVRACVTTQHPCIVWPRTLFTWMQNSTFPTTTTTTTATAPRLGLVLSSRHSI